MSAFTDEELVFLNGFLDGLNFHQRVQFFAVMLIMIEAQGREGVA